jgi:hypothetical protein
MAGGADPQRAEIFNDSTVGQFLVRTGGEGGRGIPDQPNIDLSWKVAGTDWFAGKRSSAP